MSLDRQYYEDQAALADRLKLGAGEPQNPHGAVLTVSVPKTPARGVARDLVLTVSGKEGAGKSALLNYLRPVLAAMGIEVVLDATTTYLPGRESVRLVDPMRVRLAEETPPSLEESLERAQKVSHEIEARVARAREQGAAAERDKAQATLAAAARDLKAANEARAALEQRLSRFQASPKDFVVRPALTPTLWSELAAEGEKVVSEEEEEPVAVRGTPERTTAEPYSEAVMVEVLFQLLTLPTIGALEGSEKAAACDALCRAGLLSFGIRTLVNGGEHSLRTYHPASAWRLAEAQATEARRHKDFPR